MTTTTKFVRTFIAAAASLVLGQVHAQPKPLETTAGWKTACETSPGNRVRVLEDITVSAGAPASMPLQSTSGCTIELVGDAEVQFDKIGLQFAGALVITGGSKTGVAVSESALLARSVSITLSGDEGYLRSFRGRIDATGGPITISLPRIAKVELLGARFGGVPLSNAALAATGAVSISAGERLSASMNEVGIVAGGNIEFRANGGESELKLENSGVQSFGSSVLFLMTGNKSKVEMSNSGLIGAMDVEVATGRDESGVKLSNVNVTSGKRTQIYGAGFKSEVAVLGGRINAGNGVFLSAAAGSTDGNLSVGQVRIEATTPIRMVSGRQGKTSAGNNTINGTGEIDISSDPATGVCEAVGNSINVPVQRICR